MSQHFRSLPSHSLFRDEVKKTYRLTPFIVTLSGTSLTSIDIENFIEMGLRIIRFNVTNLTRNDKIILLAKFKQAMKSFCEKYNIPSWPIAISIDLPNACIKTGCFVDDITEVFLEENDTIEITCNTKLWNMCSKDRIFMDDPYTFKLIQVGAEITLGSGKVILICTEVINEQRIMCKVHQKGSIGNLEFFCVRGIKHIKPPLSKYDLNMIEFAKEFSLDIIIMNSVRRTSVLDKVKALFKNCPTPHIISTICEQEGLDNIDDIIEASDGIILAREFLAYEILNKYQMSAIQMQISAKCRQKGKPFFISGNILDESLKKGMLVDRDVFDITNAAIDGTGFLLRHLDNPSHILVAMKILDSICKSVESVAMEKDFWRVLDEIKMPANAAEACCLACALAAKQTKSKVIVAPTVTGSTARHLARVAPEVLILTISSNPFTARKLQLYRGVIPLIYAEKARSKFEDEVNSRVSFAVSYCVKHNILKYKQTYVLLRRSTIYSGFPDQLSVRTVSSKFHIGDHTDTK
ncbi:PREDICTED: pyruvate kinase-like [Papilio xuthus]|uniref:Pyruvate kinase n=1 Tax=Papilio xuthus TaxID=66420 RepID=A0AAJ7EBU2_PAPXU|nr:PREDICTED: pyruvate kinase-like [Papilio xuthus]